MKTMKTFFTALFMLIACNLFATNLALTGTATASSGTASSAIDGNDGTRWESVQGVDPQWIKVELDAPHTINSIKIHWEAANAKVYTVKVSTDDATWTTVHTETNGASKDRWDVIEFASTEAKYVWIEGTERNLVYGYSIWELEIYEPVADAQNATLSDIKVGSTSIAGFNKDVFDYTYFVTDGVVPTVTATAEIAGATVAITPAESVPGATTILVTATDNATTQTYTINFKAPISLPLTFETGTYTWAAFGGAATEVIDNPHSTGINTSNKVVKFTKNGDTWAGSSTDIDTPIDFSTNKQLALKVYSPKQGAVIKLKLEVINGPAIEVDAPTTVANQWEELVFDFASIDINQDFVKIVVFCDYGVVGTGDIYYIDDIRQYTLEPAQDARLSDLQVGGTTIEGFAANTQLYTYELPTGTEDAPVVTATAAVVGADVEITQATSPTGAATVVVTSTDESATKTYTIQFSVKDPIVYNNYPTGHQGNPEFGDANGRILLTIQKESATSISVSVVSNKQPEAAMIDFVNVIVNGVGQSIGNSDEVSVAGQKITFTDLESLTNLTVNVLWRTPALGTGRWTTNSFTITEDQLYVAGSGTSVETATTMPRIYPNPVTDVMYVSAESRINQLSICNLQGHSIRTEIVGANSAAIHVGELSEGAYFVTIVTEDGKNHTQKMIKK